MKLLKNLAEVSVEEQRDFINSFDHVFCDMDGVIWFHYKPIPGSKDCLDNLTKVGKKITFVTNNAISSRDTIRMRLKQADLATSSEIFNPSYAIIEYLKSRNFDKKIFAVVSREFKEELRKAGFSLSAEPPSRLKEDLQEFLNNIKDDPEVGAVVVDFDINTSRLQLQKALTYIKRKDCLFIAGACDMELPLGGNIGPIIGTHHFFQSLVDFSGRNYLQISKPSPVYLEILKRHLGIQDSNNILVIGDSIPSDMGLAAAADCKKLLVLTGATKKDDLLNWTYPEELKPEYYVDSLNVLKKVLENVVTL